MSEVDPFDELLEEQDNFDELADQFENLLDENDESTDNESKNVEENFSELADDSNEPSDTVESQESDSENSVEEETDIFYMIDLCLLKLEEMKQDKKENTLQRVLWQNTYMRLVNQVHEQQQGYRRS